MGQQYDAVKPPSLSRPRWQGGNELAVLRGGSSLAASAQARLSTPQTQEPAQAKIRAPDNSVAFWTSPARVSGRKTAFLGEGQMPTLRNGSTLHACLAKGSSPRHGEALGPGLCILVVTRPAEATKMAFPTCWGKGRRAEECVTAPQRAGSVGRKQEPLAPACQARTMARAAPGQASGNKKELQHPQNTLSPGSDLQTKICHSAGPVVLTTYRTPPPAVAG